MLEHNSDVFRDCTAWKHPVCGRNWKRTQTTWQVCAHLLGARQAAGCFDAHKKGGHSHNWHRFAPSSTFVPALSDSHQRSNDGAWTAPCQLSVSFRGLEVQNPVICSYQSATVDLPPTWKKDLQESNCTVGWETPTFIVGGVRRWWRKIWRQWIQGAKFYVLEFPDFYSEDIIYWFWIKAG